VTDVKTDEKKDKACIKMEFSQKLKKTGDKVLEMRALQLLLSFFGWSFNSLRARLIPFCRRFT
jgi:hypothetical protein